MVGREIIWTGDGSPTYFLRQAPLAAGEAMHNSVGAFAETQYIYGPVVEGCFEMSSKDDSLRGPHFMSVGLGLGYNEFLIAAHGMKFLGEWTCISYETEDFLKTDLLDFVFERPMAEEKARVYEAICQRFAESLVTPAAEDCAGFEKSTRETASRLRAELRRAHEEGRWLLEPALCLKTSEVPRPIHGYLWDAFSRKTSPELWDKELLGAFLTKTRGSRALFSTYASFVDLREALTAAGFSPEIRRGFATKRESCFARFPH